MIPKATPGDIALWLILAAMWSSSFGAIKLGVASVEPAIVVVARLWIGAVVIYGVLKLRGMSLSRRLGDWKTYAISGVLGGALPFFLVTHAEQTIDSALASIFMGVAPVTTAFLAAIVFPDERLSPRILAGLGCGMAGIIILFGPGALAGIGDDIIAQASVVCAAFCYALSTIYVRRFVRRPALEMAAGSMLVAAITTTVLTPLAGATSGQMEPTILSIGAILYLGLLPTALAHLIYFHLVPRLGATRMSQINFVVPVGGALIGAMALSEPLGPSRLFAMAVIGGGILLVTTKRQA